jgi:hypothetical protein
MHLGEAVDGVWAKPVTFVVAPRAPEAHTEGGEPTTSAGGFDRLGRVMGDSEQLRELHDNYVWKVNAAVADERLDLARQFADQYIDQALEHITGGGPARCGSTDCAVCARSRPAVAIARRRRWSRRARGSAAS